MCLIFLGGTFSLMITNVAATTQTKNITEYPDKETTVMSAYYPSMNMSTGYSAINASLLFGSYTNTTYGITSELDYVSLIHFDFSKMPQNATSAKVYFMTMFLYVNGTASFNANDIPNIQKLLICTDSWNATNVAANMPKIMNDSMGIFSTSTTITKDTSKYPYVSYSVDVTNFLNSKNGFTLIVPPTPFNINNTYGTIFPSSSPLPSYAPRLVYTNTTYTPNPTTPTGTTPSTPAIAGYPILILTFSIGIVSTFLIVKKSKK